MTAHLIKPLTEKQRVCFDCQVPGGCNENHPLCRWRELGGNGKRPLSASSRQALHRQRVVLRYLQRGEAEIAELAYVLNWSEALAYATMRSLRDKGLVERIGWNGSARWRLVE